MSKKKIAILTHHWPANFGANLQAFASKSYFESLGHEVTILNYIPENLKKHYLETIPEKQLRIHESFCDTYLNVGTELRDENNLIEFVNTLRPDIVISGSDAIFRIIIGKDNVGDGSFPNAFWLDWVRKLNFKPKTAFLAASSMGTKFTKLDSNVKDQIKRLIQNVDYVSVRDDWTLKMLRYIGIADVNLCSDPTSTLPYNETIQSYIKKHKTYEERQNYVLFSFSEKWMSQNWQTSISNVLKKNNIQCYSLPFPNREIKMLGVDALSLPLEVLDWYAWIANAKGIITNRFHPIAISIFNKVPFVSIENSGPNFFKTFANRETSKVFDICRRAGMEKQCYLPIPARLTLSVKKSIKYLDSFNSSYPEKAFELFQLNAKNILSL